MAVGLFLPLSQSVVSLRGGGNAAGCLLGWRLRRFSPGSAAGLGAFIFSCFVTFHAPCGPGQARVSCSAAVLSQSAVPSLEGWR